jgi:DNA primase
LGLIVGACRSRRRRNRDRRERSFPGEGYTKRDVFDHYLAVGDGICVRCATGRRHRNAFRTASKVLQKRIPTLGVPYRIQTAKIKSQSMRTADELCPADLDRIFPVVPSASGGRAAM